MLRVGPIVCVLVLAGCSRPARPWVDRVEVDAFEGGDVISLSEPQLLSELTARLKTAKFELATEDHPVPAKVKPWRVKLAAGLSEPDPESGRSALGLVLELRHTGEEEGFSLDERQILTAADDADVDTIQNAIRSAFDDSLDKAVREAQALITLENASSGDLQKKLTDGDPAVRDAAVRLLVRAHDASVLPTLLERLKSDDVDALRGVVGLLVELKAPASVNPLVEAAGSKGPVFAREVVFAVSAIGGDDAEAYLDLVASGAEDPIIRASAEQALSELRARKPHGEPK